jgi:tetratricopeptide (TPR) repeat protein
VPPLVRRLLLPVAFAAGLLAASRNGSRVVLLVLLFDAAVLVGLFVVLPRLAHAAFERGDFGRAELYYRMVRFFVVRPQSRGAIGVSLAGCRLARADWGGALADLAEVEPAALAPAARAAWYNNRAYALARGSRPEAEALQAIDEAVRLCPEVTGFRHTRGVVLLALGRTDDAIAVLDGLWPELAGAGPPPMLEAERCYDLGVAWTQKGEADYARDYFQRAVSVAPRSPWGAKAAAALAAA